MLVVLMAVRGSMAQDDVEGMVFDAAKAFKYTTNNLDGINWKAPGYNDSAWPSGPGLLWADQRGLNTNLPLTATQLPLNSSTGYPWTTYYFRTHFNFTNSPAGATLTLSNYLDDGAVFYLNGVEIARAFLPLPPASILNSTLATSYNCASGDATCPYVFSITGDLITNLVPGDNVLAVEVHNYRAGSPDVTFGSALLYTIPTPPFSPLVMDLVTPAFDSTLASLTFINVVFSDDVVGVDAGDLLVNGVPATTLSVVSGREYQFNFAQPSAGAVAISWAAGHGIVDQATGSNHFAGGTWSYLLNPPAPPPPVVISEFMTDNAHGLRDDDGNRSDWIELYNLGPQDANLNGWFLTDDATNPNKWRFPNLTLGARQYLLVWASGNDRTNPTAPLHTNFKLDPKGEYLALLDPNLTVASAFAPTYPPQTSDVSYGRDAADPSIVGYFTTPTPGARNTTSGVGFAPTPVFSIDGGIYTNDLLTITISASSGTIRYTVDNSTPTNNSPLYTGPITFGTNATIKARVFQANLWPSPIVAKNYIFLDSTTRDFNSNLPLLILNTSGRAIQANIPPGQPRIPGSFFVMDTVNGRSSFRNTPQFQGLAGFEIFGQTSANFPKKPYNIEIQDELGNDLAVPVLGLPAEADWKLRNPYSDKCMMNDFLGYELFEKMGHYSCRRRFVEVFVASSGGRLNYQRDYSGILVLFEKIEQGKDRVDIAKLLPTDATEPNISGGYMFKKDKDSTGDLGFTTGGGSGFSGQYLKIHEPKPRDITTPQFNWLQNYLGKFEGALYAANWLSATGTNHYSFYMDPDSFADFHWIVEFTKQIDGYRLSDYMQKDRNGRVKMEPIWDWNLAFGNANYLQGGLSAGWYYNQLGDVDHIWLRRLITGTTSASSASGDPDFVQKIADRWSVLRTNVFNATNVNARIDELAALLTEAAARDFVQFPRLGTYIWPNPNGAAGGWDVDYVSPTTYAGIITNMKSWMMGRYLWIDSQFTQVPAFNHASGQIASGTTLVISGPSGSAIYYTLNGTDPRLPGGGISPLAASAVGATAFPISSNVCVVARAKGSGSWYNTWSGPAVSTLYTVLPSLRITELMYHPEPPPSGDTNDVENFEYVELTNIGSNTLSLVGFRFTNGIDFTFTATNNVTSLAPGGRVLIVANSLAFLSRYPGLDSLVAGEYAGRLNNGGEEIALIGPMGEPICDFTYDNNWYPLTDGPGFSLVPVSEFSIPSGSNASQWRQSAYDGGSPGAPDPAPVSILPVLVNEIMTYAFPPAGDAIELFNPNPTTVNLSYWYLTDDHNAPKKYLIPPGTTIAPYKFAVFSETSSFGVHGSINALGMVNDAFGLSSAGEEVYVYSGDATGRLTGYYQGFNFGAAAQGVTFGRYVNSIGEVDLVAQSVPTLGLTNAPPLVGPVVISEIMYDPPDLFVGGVRTSNVRDEFIELRNLTNAVVPLYDPAHPTNTWHIRDGVSFDFPMGVKLPANGFALVVGFDPVLDPASLGAFRGRYGLGTNVGIYGPYAGPLDDGGAQIELRRPSTPDASTGIAPMVLLDRVHYGVTNPWPATASGTGASLQRKVLTGFGNDPTNWFAAGPSAGADYVAGTPPSITAQPQPVTIMELSAPSFSVVANGTAPFLYQWCFNGQPMDGAYGSTLVLSNVQVSQAGDYSVLVLNGSGLIQSSNAHLTVLALPTITQQPVSTNVPPYGTASFRVTAIGTGSLSYRWQFNGTNLTNNGTTVVGATTNTLVLSNLLYDSAGLYQVLVTDSVGTRVSQAASLGVMAKPVITNQPVSMTVAAGQTAMLNVGVDGSPPFYFRWRRNAQTLVAFGSSVLTLTNVVPTNGGTYDVVITNLAAIILGGTTYARSSNAYVNVVQPPTNQVVPPGTNVTLRAIVGGPLNFTNRFWWLSNDTVIQAGSNNGSNIFGLFTNDLVLTNVTSAQSGRYTFLLSNAVINTITNINTNTVPAVTNIVSVTNYPVPPAAFTATLVVGYPPMIGQQPSDQTVLAGDTVSFVVVATGSDPLGYQWIYNEQVLAGQTGPGLTLNQVQASQSGDYSAIVTNPAGSVTSRLAMLTVLMPPVILQQPTNQSVDLGTNALFVVVAGGTAPLSYQWWYNGSNLLAGAGDGALAITNVQSTNLGSYQVVVSNALGVVTSLVATLSLPAPPSITRQPLDQNVLPGSNAVFVVVATGAAPLSYRWWFNATNAVTGGNGSTLTLTNVQWANGGGYQVLVSNRMGVAASQTARLVVVTPDQVKLQNVVLPAGPGQAVTISFFGLAGLSYTVQYRDELNTGNWLVLTNVAPSGVNQTLMVQDWEAAAKSQRFYRIVTPMQQP